MQVVVNNGKLSEAEQEHNIRQITTRFPVEIVEKIILDVHDEYVDVEYILHEYRTVRKMGGYCIGVPSEWNEAKQAEMRDTVVNPIE